MNNYMSAITPDMTNTVNKLVASNFEGATADEIEVYAQWRVAIALQSDELEQVRRARDEQMRQDAAEGEQARTNARNLLDELARKAAERLERANNEQAQQI